MNNALKTYSQTPYLWRGKTMKIKRGAALLLCTFLCFNLAFAQSINIQTKKASFKELLQIVRKQSGYNFFYKESDIDLEKKIAINLKDVEIKKVLDVIAREYHLNYSVKNNIINFSKANSSSERQRPESSKSSEKEIVQHLDVSGIVIDDQGKKLAGATVRIKGTDLLTFTDQNGHFIIRNVPLDGHVMVFFAGFKPAELHAKPNLGIINLQSFESKIEEVVLTGIVTRKAESFTGAAVTIKGEDLQRVGNINIFQSLKNLDPTINIMENMTMGSDPNSMPEMDMRGGTSFSETTTDNNLKGNYQNKPNQPLFILDGFEVSVERVFDMDMNQVESLTILKDASAKALYGSKAANGVVVIESKKLKSNKPRISYNGSLDVTMPDLSSYDLANALEKLEIEYRENQYPETSPASQDKYYKLRKQVLGGLDTYWLSKPVRFGYGQKHGLNLEFGKDELRTSIGINHFDNVGVMKESGRKTLAGNIVLSYLVRKFRFQNSLNITNNNSSDSPYGLFSTYTTLNPYSNPYDENGNLKQILEDGSRNPLSDAEVPTSLTSKYLELTNNFEAEYSLSEKFRFRGRVGLVKKTNNADRYYPAEHSRFANYTIDQAIRKGQYESNNGYNNRYSADFYINYNEVIAKDHRLFATIGTNIAENQFREEVNYAEGFPSALMNDIMFAYQYNSQIKRPSGRSGFTREFGLLSMASYTYQDRFLFDGTYRINASSVFGNENLFAPFWSVGLGWNLHKETFLRQYEQIKMLKIRGSLGSTGNQNFLNNKSLTVNNYYFSDRYGTLIGSYAANMENPELKWEQKMDYNVGLDADLYGVTLRFDAYRTITENLVTSISTAPSTGFMNVSDNLGRVQNKGYELSLAYTLFNNKNGFLRVSSAITQNDNRILEISEAMKNYNDRQLANINERTNIGEKSAPVQLYYNGLAMNTIWAVPSYGIDPATGVELLLGRDGKPTYIWKASDMVPSGISVPKWRGNMGLNGEYKGFGLSVSLTYLAGGQLYNQTLLNKIENVDITSNFDRRVLTDRWTSPGQLTQYKRNTGSTPYDMRYGLYYYSNSGWMQEPTRPTQRFVQNQNELNISSVSLSYDFNRQWIQAAKLERLRMTVYMNDVAKFSTIGIERGTSYPFARTISGKISATF